MFRNRALNSFSKELLDFFSFNKPINENYTIEIINYLSKLKLKEKSFESSAVNSNLEFFKGSMAAELLFFDK